MRLMVRGKNVELTPSLREYAELRLSRVAVRLPAEVPVELELELVEEPRSRHVAEGTIFTKGTTLRASESATSLRAAIDKLAANLERQTVRYREKRRFEPRRRTAHHGG